jgi:hypothetical protein
MPVTRAADYTNQGSRPSGRDCTVSDSCLHTETLAPGRLGA